MASRLVFVGSVGSIVDTRRRARRRRSRVADHLAARGRGVCMRLRRGADAQRQRFCYPIVRTNPRLAFDDLHELHS